MGETTMCKVNSESSKVNTAASEPERMLCQLRAAVKCNAALTLGLCAEYLKTWEDGDAVPLESACGRLAEAVARFRAMSRAMSEAAVRSEGTASGDVPVFMATVPEVLS